MKNETKIANNTKGNDTLEQLHFIKDDLKCLKKSVAENNTVDNILNRIFKLGSLEDDCYGLYVNSTEQEVDETYHDILKFKAELFDIVKKKRSISSENITNSTTSNDTSSNNKDSKEQDYQKRIAELAQTFECNYEDMTDSERRFVQFGIMWKGFDEISEILKGCNITRKE